MSEIPIDESTGLPVLPEGYFWHVSSRELRADEDPFYYRAPEPRIYVELRKEAPKKWYHRKPQYVSVQYRTVPLYTEDESYHVNEVNRRAKKWIDVNEESVKAAILKAALTVYKSRQESLEQEAIQQETRAIVAKLTGSYPPKKL